MSIDTKVTAWISNETIVAMRAMAQWEHGDPNWVDYYLELIESDTPLKDVRDHIGDEDDANEVITYVMESM